MDELIGRFEREFYENKNPEILDLILSRILNLNSEFVSITTFKEGKLIFLNDAFLKVVGWKKEDIIGRTVHQLNLYVDPEKRDEVKAKLTDDDVLEKEVNFRGDNGEIVSYLLKVQTINLFGRECIITVGWDITRRRQLEEQLHAALKNDLRQTIKAVDNMVCKLTIGQDGRLTFALSEGKIAQSLGFTTEVSFGKTINELFPPELLELFEPHINIALAGETTSFEVEVGDRVLIKSLAPYYENDIITGVVGSAIDITERKKLEKLLQVSELNAVLGQLAAGAAHEIRNPLTAIRGFVQLIGEILKKNNIDKGRDYVEMILSELARINHLVSEMLWLRKPKESVYETVNVSKLLQEVLPLVYVEANMKSIQVSLQVNSNSPSIEANLDLLKQVILNICKNGIEAMDNGGSLHISESYSEHDMSILIKDTGPGIPDNLEDKIFTPFFTTKPTGNGLGLFISRQIVKDMDGDIHISSDSSGTLVTLRFPLCKQKT
ncbi:PAS domain-containing sensor histidine kinase [Cohnella kolymensis]|uniref:PAS domain-containing sensor histidine kinase n=1 Tax=Cohnella kolymensis TaxID=1590652 RepID=UPI000697059B|nr:PAS domain-containing sensor histidine kinase [Cohnella kolymensis]